MDRVSAIGMVSNAHVRQLTVFNDRMLLSNRQHSDTERCSSLMKALYSRRGSSSV